MTAAVLARVIYAGLPLRSDEGGYLLAARRWSPGAGEFMYGDYHVDRPPLLLGLYRVAALWESDAAIRLLTIPVVLLAIVALARAGYLLGGHAGARGAAIVSASLFCSPALGGEQADAGLFAASFVAISVMLALTAFAAASARTAVVLFWAAGGVAAAAVLVKQSFVEGAVFAGALLVADATCQRRLSRRHLLLALAAGGGLLAAVASAAAWALSAGIDLRDMWADLISFRGDALSVILHGSLQAPATRAGLLVLMALLSGALPIVLVWAAWLREGRHRARPESWAVSATLACGVLSLAGGGSYWRQYLLELAPSIALAVGLVIGSSGRWSGAMRALTVFSAATAVIGVVGMAAGYAHVPHYSYPLHIGRWLAASSQPGDTAVVGYGHPHILESADLASPYPYLWSLPMRTLDPRQARLRSTLTSPSAPTWVVLIDSIDSWDIDEDARTRAVLERRYHPAAEICGFRVLLRNDLPRRPAPPPSC